MAVCTILHGVAQGLSIYVWLYAVRLIIGIFESSSQPEVRMQDVRFHFVELWSAKIDEWLDGYFYSKLSERTMTMDYPMTESPETLGQCRKAQEGMAGLTGCFLAVFAENTIKEYGTHEELVEKDKGIYAEMFMAQAQYYA